MTESPPENFRQLWRPAPWFMVWMLAGEWCLYVECYRASFAVGLPLEGVSVRRFADRWRIGLVFASMSWWAPLPA